MSNLPVATWAARELDKLVNKEAAEKEISWIEAYQALRNERPDIIALYQRVAGYKFPTPDKFTKRP